MPATTNVEKEESSNKTPTKNTVDNNGESVENGASVPDVEKESEQNETVESREKLIAEATTLLAQGKRHLFVKDYPSAVNVLGDACGKFSDIYGQLAYECADANFNYGCALLELAREESGVVEVDNKDKDSDSEEGGNEDETGEVKEGTDDQDKTEEKAVESKEGEDGKPTEDKQAENEEEEKEGEDEEDDEEDVNNLQLAWEIFELAKRSFELQNDQIKLAETYLKLGEVALESENYDGAITDIQQCLELQKKILPPVSREIAETYFQLGVACSLSNQFDEAIKHFTSAGNILESRIENLSKITEPEPEKAKNPFYSINNEIEEIKALLPEIKDKIIDMEEFKKETMKVVQASMGIGSSKESNDGAGSSNGASASTVSKGPANDISHLIRKKRKPDESSESEPKKPNLETKTT